MKRGKKIVLALSFDSSILHFGVCVCQRREACMCVGVGVLPVQMCVEGRD